MAKRLTGTDVTKAFERADRMAVNRRLRAFHVVLWAHREETVDVDVLIDEARKVDDFLAERPEDPS